MDEYLYLLDYGFIVMYNESNDSCDSMRSATGTPMTLKLGLLCSALLMAQAQPVAADQIILRDGSRVEGVVIARHGGRSTVRSPQGDDLTLPTASIERIIPTAGGQPPMVDGGSGGQSSATQAPAGPVRLTGSTTIGEKLMPALLLEYLRTMRVHCHDFLLPDLVDRNYKINLTHSISRRSIDKISLIQPRPRF